MSSDDVVDVDMDEEPVPVTPVANENYVSFSSIGAEAPRDENYVNFSDLAEDGAGSESTI